jgi:hypothetical protein
VDGETLRCPKLELCLRFDADLRETGINPHQGNWDDKWAPTQSIRDAVNRILQRHGFNDDYVSNQTFVFVRSLEELAFQQIGRECKGAVRTLICDEAPGVVISEVYWNGRQFNVIMRDQADYKRVKRKIREKVEDALPELFAAADTDKCCRTYKPSIELGYEGASLFHVIRENLGA